MDLFVFLALLQDGITTGAIYLLLAIGLLIVFSVTRVIFVPQGDLLAFGTLTAATLQSGQLPGTLWLLDGVAAAALIASLFGGWRSAVRGVVAWGVYPFVVTMAAVFLAPREVPAISILLALAIVTPMGPLIWRFAFRPIADASVLALLILAMALHFVLIGLGLVFFGPEEASAPSLTDASFEIGLLNVSGQSLIVLACCATLVLGLRWFFGATMHGKVLRAAASDRLGARLVGIDASATGALAFGLASFIAALAGVLIGAVTPLSYDAGFDIGLKGFVAAIMGGLVSYPMAAAGAVLVGVLESLGSFWASAYREVIVFTVLIPVLVFLSLRSGSAEDRA
ncbi:MAG TPA: branched-chain amino acid ABC transporter permease [Acetobacteraceae bacterium]|jgi:branched-chain amino acid transport system permease protein|nr:branched-chain amino acid ABC transporter permease [Acetobacteraceae bacterium]